MVINFVGNFQSGYVGEKADETHLADSMEALGHIVRRIPRDVWREWVMGNYKERPKEIPEDLKSDINIIAKWYHFFGGGFIRELKTASEEAPVFYWCWDYMWDQGLPQWHLDAIEASDLYLGNDVRCGLYPQELKSKLYYFPFDVANERLETYVLVDKKYKYEVSFFGSLLGQGDRRDWLVKINKGFPIKVFSWNFEEWKKLGFDAEPAVYGNDFNREVSKSKMCLGFSVYPSCWGYWSNRVGKTLLAGGFLLYQYAPGMELFLGDSVAYFSSPEEAIEKLKYYSWHDNEREGIRQKGIKLGREKFSSSARVKELMILIERYLKGGIEKWQI